MTSDFLDSSEGQSFDFQAMAVYQAINGSAPSYSTYLTALQGLRNGGTGSSLFNSVLSQSSLSLSMQATITGIYTNLLGRAPTSAEMSSALALNNAYQTFSNVIGGAEFQSTATFKTDHTNSLYVTMLYYLITLLLL